MASNQNPDIDNDLLKPLGASGTRTSFGFITNEEYLPQLLWRKGIEVYDHMRRSDASIHGMLTAVKHPLLAAHWDVEPASDEEFDQFVCRFVRNELFNRNVKMRKFLRDALGKLDFGFAVFEKTYEMTQFEGKQLWGVQDLGWRKQWSILRWATSMNEPGVTQELLSGPVDIPQIKLLTFVNDQEGDNYQGVSVLRYVYKAWEMKKALENYLMVAAQRSIGFPYIEYTPDISLKDQQKLENMLKNMRNHEQQYMFFPGGKVNKLDWMKIETNMKSDLLPAIEHLQHEIDKSVLAQFLDLAGSTSGGSGGSRALSEDHSQLFEKALEAIANEIVDEMNTNLIQQLCDINFSKMPNGYPKLVYSNIGDQNLQVLADYASKLASMDLLTPDRDMENWFRQAMGTSDLPDDIYDNYESRMTAQTKAQPLTQLGPGQDPNTPAPTGQPLQNPPVDPKAQPNQKPGDKPVEDQGNTVTRTNEKKDNANKPTPNPSSYYKYRATKASDALEEAKKARMALQMAYMGE